MNKVIVTLNDRKVREYENCEMRIDDGCLVIHIGSENVALFNVEEWAAAFYQNKKDDDNG